MIEDDALKIFEQKIQNLIYNQQTPKYEDNIIFSGDSSGNDQLRIYGEKMIEVIKSFVSKIRNEMLTLSEYNYTDIASNDISSIRLANMTLTNLADFCSQNTSCNENFIKIDSKENSSPAEQDISKKLFHPLSRKLSSIREEESGRIGSAKEKVEKGNVEILVNCNEIQESSKESCAKLQEKNFSLKKNMEYFGNLEEAPFTSHLQLSQDQQTLNKKSNSLIEIDPSLKLLKSIESSSQINIKNISENLNILASRFANTNETQTSPTAQSNYISNDNKFLILNDKPVGIHTRTSIDKSSNEDQNLINFNNDLLNSTLKNSHIRLSQSFFKKKYQTDSSIYLEKIDSWTLEDLRQEYIALIEKFKELWEENQNNRRLLMTNKSDLNTHESFILPNDKENCDYSYVLKNSTLQKGSSDQNEEKKHNDKDSIWIVMEESKRLEESYKTLVSLNECLNEVKE